MSKHATNVMCKVETAIFLIATVSGIIFDKTDNGMLGSIFDCATNPHDS